MILPRMQNPSIQNLLILRRILICRSAQLLNLAILSNSDSFLFSIMKSFPPVDDFLTYLGSDSFQNHKTKFLGFVMLCMALVYVLGDRLGCWYKSGGKERLVSYIQKLIRFLMSFLNWCDTELLPSLYYVGPFIRNAYDRILSFLLVLVYHGEAFTVQP